MMLQPRVQTQSKDKRLKNFEEVSQGLPKKVCFEEAKRCPQCSDPTCKPGCPLGIDIPGFIRLLREGEPTQALQKIQEENDFPSICGRICLAPCEKSCVLEKEAGAIGIRALERFAVDHGKPSVLASGDRGAKSQRIAVVGSGPTGLTAAARLSRQGYGVTVFEAAPAIGGLLRYGVAQIRLPRRILDQEVERLRNQGVEFLTHCHVGRVLSIAEIFNQGFIAVLLAVGNGAPRLDPLPGTDLAGVYHGREFLIKTSPLGPKDLAARFPLAVGKQVVVLGGGYMAADCARLCARRGCQVSLVFSQTEGELEIHSQDREDLLEEGVEVVASAQALELISDGNNMVSGVKCVRMDFADVNSSGPWQLMPVPDSEFVLDAQTVILAVNPPQPLPLQRWISELNVNENGSVWIDPKTGMTSIRGVFAAGDVVTSAGRVVDAMASGKKSAKKIVAYLKA